MNTTSILRRTGLGSLGAALVYEAARKVNSAPTEPIKVYKRSAETRAKIAFSCMGRRHSPETCKKLSEIAKARIIPDEVRDKIAASLTGIPKTPETKAKMKASQIERCRKLRLVKSA